MNVRLSEYQKVKLNHSKKAYEIMHNVLMRESKLRRSQEHFWIIGINNSLNTLFVELISLGADNKVMVNPREVFRIAINKMAQNIILVHNHPSGTIEASIADIEITKFYVKAGKFLNVGILDHLIITEYNGYTSLSDNGQIVEFENGYNIKEFEFDKELNEPEIKLQMKRIEKETKRIVAKRLYKYKTSLETIKKVTGLTMNQIKKAI